MYNLWKIAAAILALLYVIVVLFDILFAEKKSIPFYIAAIIVAVIFVFYIIHKNKQKV